jgi:hypothetical protein
MPPKRVPWPPRAPSIPKSPKTPPTPKTPTTAELAAMMLNKHTENSSPLLAKSKNVETEIQINEEETVEKNEVHIPDAADDSGIEETSAKQGTAEKKKTALKRKAAPTDDTAKPAAKKQKATHPKRKAAPKKPTTAPRKKSKKEEQLLENDPPPPPRLPPLPAALKRKYEAIDIFDETHPVRLLDHKGGTHVVSVEYLDLLAGLVILQVDYQLARNTVPDASLEDASEMIVGRLPDGRVSVDFNKSCDLERAAQAKFKGRNTMLEMVNLLEVEIDMLVARRKQLAADEMPTAGFRVYDDQAVGYGAGDHEGVEKDPTEGDDVVLGESIMQEDQLEEDVIEDVAVGEDVIEEGVIKDVDLEMAAIEKDMLDAQRDDDESEEVSEEE